MNKIFGYGEDALTLWALKEKEKKYPYLEILKKFNDQSAPEGCLVFYRPSFGRGRSGIKGTAEFGEFDAIIASSENVYLIESKWDNLSQNTDDEIKLDEGQVLRHKIFSWYFMNWDAQEYCDWREFSNTLQKDFMSKFSDRKIALGESILAKNLEFVLRKLHKHCKKEKAPKNVLVYFYNSKKSKPITRIIAEEESLNFEVVNIDYEPYISGNFIPLD